MHFSLVYKGLICLDLKEKNRKKMCIFNPIRKKSDARVYRVRKKIKQATQQFQIHGSEKKQDHLKIVLTCNMANYKDIQQNSFFLFSKLAEV